MYNIRGKRGGGKVIRGGVSDGQRLIYFRLKVILMSEEQVEHKN